MLAYVSFISDKLAVDEFHKRLIFKWFSIVYIARSQHIIQNFSFFVTDDMKFEPEKLSHRAFASLGYALECLVDQDPLAAAYTQWRTVNETYASAFA